MARLAPQDQAETLEAALAWPMQLDEHLSSIKETFNRLSQELDVTRRERDEYKAQLDAQSKELDDFRKFVDLRGATSEKDEQNECTATSPATPECHLRLDEVGQNVVHENQESYLYRNDIPARANPITEVFESAAGSPLDDSDKAISEVSKYKGSAIGSQINNVVKKIPDIRLVHTLREGSVNSVRFSPDGKYLATVCQDGVTKIYETETGNNVYVLVDRYLTDKYTDQSINGVDLRTVCFSPDNRYLATAGMDRTIRIWEIGKKGIRNIFKVQSNIYYSSLLDFLPNGRFIVSASADSKVRVWNMRTGTPTIFKGSIDPIWIVRSSPDGRYIAAGATNMAAIWDVRSRALVNCSLEHPGHVNGVDFNKDGMRLVTGSSNGILKLWDISSLKLAEQPLAGQQQGGTVDGVQCLRSFDDAGYVWTVALLHDQWVLSGENGDGAYFWDLCDGKRQCLLQIPQMSPFLVTFSPMGDHLAVGTSDKQVMVWTYRII